MRESEFLPWLFRQKHPLYPLPQSPLDDSQSSTLPWPACQEQPIGLLVPHPPDLDLTAKFFIKLFLRLVAADLHDVSSWMLFIPFVSQVPLEINPYKSEIMFASQIWCLSNEYRVSRCFMIFSVPKVFSAYHYIDDVQRILFLYSQLAWGLAYHNFSLCICL